MRKLVGAIRPMELEGQRGFVCGPCDILAYLNMLIE